MAFCSRCGAASDSAFCSQCGAPIGVATAGGAAAAATPVSAGLQTNVASMLCYVLGLVTGIVFLVIPPYNQNPVVRFHAFQSIFVHFAWIVLWIGYSMTASFLPLPLHVLLSLFSLVLGLGGFLLWLYLVWKAYQGQKVVLPVVGPMAEQAAAKA